MYDSNAVAKQWLLSNNYNYLVVFTHTRYGMPHTWKENGVIKSHNQKDLYALFDGICLDKNGKITFFQVKTNAFPNTDAIQTFIRKTTHTCALGINVIRGRIRVRLYNGKSVKEITPDIRTFINRA